MKGYETCNRMIEINEYPDTAKMVTCMLPLTYGHKMKVLSSMEECEECEFYVERG